jgi:GT2 family glycosyltransferase/4-amino-4-deoxy-L-arabinose transferase-like glycosyltransferase
MSRISSRHRHQSSRSDANHEWIKEGRQDCGKILMNRVFAQIYLSGWRRTVIFIFLIALLMRVGFVLSLQDGFYFPDSLEYSASAVNLIAHGQLGDTFTRSPIYPFFLAGVYLLLGQEIIVIRLVEALVGAGLAVAIAIMARRIGGEAVGRLGGLLWSIYPTGVFIVGLVYPTNLATILLAGAVLCMGTETDQELAAGRVVVGGILLGLAALTVPVVLATVVFASLWIIYWQPTRRFGMTALFLFGVAISVVPWTVRNFYVHDRFVLVEPRLVEHLPSMDNTQEDAGGNNSDGKVKAILGNPGTFAVRYVRELGHFWELYPERILMSQSTFRQKMYEEDPRIVRETIIGTSWTSLLSILSEGPMYFFALIGIGTMSFQKERRRDLSLLCLTILSFALGYSFFWGKMRYRIPVEPYIVILCAYGLWQSWLALKKRSTWYPAPDGERTCKDEIMGGTARSARVEQGAVGSPTAEVLTPELTSPIRLSIIVPVYNNPQDLRECLSALIALSCPGSEIIVVDDASTDDTAFAAAQMGTRVLQLADNSGPAAARNVGARHAQGEILFFVDADVVVAPRTVQRVRELFAKHADLAAVFGSYDARPRAGGIISQYRNLLHHFVHQTASPEASTFWAGCGAIRRSVFEELGGFDVERFPRPSIEDIELGYRLRQAGHRILLDKALQVTHLKRWTLRSLIRTDIFHRAIPWSCLILESKKAPDDLNLKGEQRVSVALVGLASICLLLAVFRFELLILGAAALFGVILLNRQLFAFFLRQRGFFFAITCIPFHLLHYLYSGLSYLYVWSGFQLKAVMTHSLKRTHRSKAWFGKAGRS